jgi:hypothetical protein
MAKIYFRPPRFVSTDFDSPSKLSPLADCEALVVRDLGFTPTLSNNSSCGLTCLEGLFNKRSAALDP